MERYRQPLTMMLYKLLLQMRDLVEEVLETILGRFGELIDAITEEKLGDEYFVELQHRALNFDKPIHKPQIKFPHS